MKDAMTDHKAEWVLVPRVATQEMVDAAFDASGMDPAEELANTYAAMIAAAPAASEGEDGAVATLRNALSYVGYRTDGSLTALAERAELWMRESKVLLDHPLPCDKCESTHPAAQVAATPKHDEGREAVSWAITDGDKVLSTFALRFQAVSHCVAPNVVRPLVFGDTQPAARRVTDDPRIAELIAAAQELADEQVYSDHAEPDYEPEDGKHNGPPAKARNKHQRAYWRLRAALESFAQPAEGVSRKKHDGPCWRNSHADCGC